MPVVMIGDRGSQYLQIETKLDGSFVLSVRDPLNEFELRLAFAKHEVKIISSEFARAAERAGDADPPSGSRAIKIIRPDGDESASQEISYEPVHPDP